MNRILPNQKYIMKINRSDSPTTSAPGLRRRVILQSALAAATGAGLGAPAVLRAQPSAQAPIRITLPSPGSAGSVWQPVIEKFLSPELTRGLNFQWVTADPGKMQVQLAAGSLDVGVFGTAGLANLVNRGQDIVLFGPALNNHGRWLVRGDSPFHKPSDLIGKRIATQPETSETYLQARIAASLIGIDLKRDVQVIHGPPTANLALFERGDVDAVIVLEPTATRLVAAGAREIARVGDIWRQATGQTDTPFLVGLAAQREWVERNRAVASRLARLFAAANQRLHDEPAIFQKVHTAIGIRDDEKAAIALLPKRLPSAYSTRWDRSVWGVIDRQVEVALKTGLLTQAPKRSLYDGVGLEGA
ncbi:MAG: hypothetical protein CK604_10635 [Curvibacter sp. PD_MW3]|nr:MAG: hypothetical protein CK604_10635 [Curvibacter sp. PD_MW3]